MEGAWARDRRGFHGDDHRRCIRRLRAHRVTSARSSPAIAATTTASASRPARIVRRGDPQRRTVALTFDVGNDSAAGAVAQILATLRSEQVRASFAVTGLWAEQNHALILAITSDGDQVINGTYDGASFTGASTGVPLLTAAERSLELQRTETTIYHLTGRSTRPMPARRTAISTRGRRSISAAAGYSAIILSTVDTQAWRRFSARVAAVRWRPRGRARSTNCIPAPPRRCRCARSAHRWPA